LTEEPEDKPVASAEEYRKLWQPEEVVCPSGLKVEMAYLDPLEHLLLYIDEDKVAEYERRSLEEIAKESEKSVKQDERKAQIKLLSNIVVKPKIVEGKPNNSDELGFDEIKISDRRFLVSHAMNHVGFSGRASELRKFRGLLKAKGGRGPRSGKVRSKTEQPAGSNT